MIDAPTFVEHDIRMTYTLMISWSLFEVAKSFSIFQKAFAAWSTTYHRLDLSNNLKRED